MLARVRAHFATPVREMAGAERGDGAHTAWRPFDEAGFFETEHHQKVIKQMKARSRPGAWSR